MLCAYPEGGSSGLALKLAIFPQVNSYYRGLARMEEPEALWERAWSTEARQEWTSFDLKWLAFVFNGTDSRDGTDA